MKTVIVHGTIEQNKTKKFKCLECGCVFEASDCSDYFTSFTDTLDFKYGRHITSRILSNCPECGKVAYEVERSITCREKLMREHPNYVDKIYVGGCKGCPIDYDYLDEPDNCPGLGGHGSCADCWNRSISD